MEPTLRGDLIAERVRNWYEQNRPGYFSRQRQLRELEAGCADDFMLGLVAAVDRATAEVDAIGQHFAGNKAAP